ncbi:MAG: hypothetical protein LC127_14120 [Chitinophagales bacterium]|nr:hypothetical protein [Chitinophagales bacterium]
MTGLWRSCSFTGLDFATNITSTPGSEPYATLIRRYMLNHQVKMGMGLHIEGHQRCWEQHNMSTTFNGIKCRHPSAQEAEYGYRKTGAGIYHHGEVLSSLLGP